MNNSYYELIPILDRLIKAVKYLDKIPTYSFDDYYWSRKKLLKHIHIIDYELWNNGIDTTQYLKIDIGVPNKALMYIANEY